MVQLAAGLGGRCLLRYFAFGPFGRGTLESGVERRGDREIMPSGTGLPTQPMASSVMGRLHVQS